MTLKQQQIKHTRTGSRSRGWRMAYAMGARRRKISLWSAIAVLVAMVGVAPARADSEGKDRFPTPLVIGHRGTHGYLPAHTLEGYALALELGADFIEPDLVSTKDGHLIARHEPNLIATTDVAARAEFANRKRTAIVDGVAEVGFFASDFTLAEIKKLRAVQDFADRSQEFNGRFQIPTLEEVIGLAKRKSKEKGRTIGIYPETKHPTYHKQLGLALEPRLVKILKAEGWDDYDSPVFIQSFEQSNLKELRKMTKNKLVQLVDADDVNADGTISFVAPFDRPYDWTVSGNPTLTSRTFGYFTTDAGLKEIKSYADGIGPWKVYIVRTKVVGGKPVMQEPTDLIERAHKAGLMIHTWTFRNEQKRLLAEYKGNPVEEYLQFYDLGIDGVFSDFTDTAVTARLLFKLVDEPKFARCLVEGADSHWTKNADCFDDN